MASNTTCRACLRSISSRRNLILTQSPRAAPLFRTSAAALLPSPRRNLSASSRQRFSESNRDASAQSKIQPEPVEQDSAVVRIAKELRKRATPQTETYIAYGGTQRLLKECSRHAEYKISPEQVQKGEIAKTKEEEDLGVGGGWWHDELGLQPTFSTWTHVTFLYMYLLTTRLRHFPPETAPQWHQHLTDHFFSRAEELMVTNHGMTAGSVRSKYLKDLFNQWRGVLVSYDEGLMKGDAVLAAAIWRNLFKGKEDVDYKVLAQVVSWMRRELVRLQDADDLDIGSGSWEFGNPKDDADGVLVESRLMREGVDGELP